MPPNNPTRYKKSNKLEVDVVHRNVSQELIEITEDKLNIILREYKGNLEKKKGWHTPLALSLAIILVLTTTDFKASFGFSAEKWSAIFTISLIAFLIWFLIELFNAKLNTDVDNLIRKIKNQSD